MKSMDQVDSFRASRRPVGPVEAEGFGFISPLLAEALSFWRSLRRDARFPRRADMQPEQVVALWPYILMVDVLDDGDYFVRLFGQTLVDAYGEQTGRKVSESSVPAVVRERCKLLFDYCVVHAVPCYAYWPAAATQRRALFDIEALCLPLSGDGTKLDRLMSLNVNSRTKL